MDHFNYRAGRLYCEEIPLENLARDCGTPLYVYSRATLLRHCLALIDAFAKYPTMACFAVKSNSNLSVMKAIFATGMGADLVSVGELERALLAGADPKKIVFSGVGKRDDEIARALSVGIHAFNVESHYELETLIRLANAMGKNARVSLRVNPNIDAKTNEKIATGLYSTKFGLTEAELLPLCRMMANDRRVKLVGIGCHIGSQITELGPLNDAAQRMAQLASDLRKSGFPLESLDLGGGLGIRYKDEEPPSLTAYADTVIKHVAPTGLKLIIEPGRVLVGNCGVLLSRVIGVKATPDRHFIVLDAAMNDLIRPSIYDAYHDIVPVKSDANAVSKKELCDFVGPVCETGDFLGKDRIEHLPAADDLFAVRGAGAYGSSMASQYNSRPRAAEVMVDGAKWTVVRPRETLASLWKEELEAL